MPHCWSILSNAPKWNSRLNDRKGKGRASAEDDASIEQEAGELQRPIHGRKKSKLLAAQQQMKRQRGDDDVGEKISEEFRISNEIMKERRNSAREAYEAQIMAMDLDSLTDDWSRLYYREKKRMIYERLCEEISLRANDIAGPRVVRPRLVCEGSDVVEEAQEVEEVPGEVVGEVQEVEEVQEVQELTEEEVADLKALFE